MNINKNLLSIGLKSIIVNYGYRGHINSNITNPFGKDGEDTLVLKCIELMFEENLAEDLFVKEFDSSDFSSFLSSCQRLGIDCRKDERVYSTIKVMALGLEQEIKKWRAIGYSERNTLDLYSRLINSMDVEDINISTLETILSLTNNMQSWHRSSLQSSLSNIYSVYFKIRGSDAEGYKGILKEYVKDIKKLKKEVRLPIFKGLIKSGKLDKKTARKIRSDASEYVSEACITFLFDHQNLYDAKSFKTLFLQFGDSNYYSVRRYLAEHVPANEIMCLMGTNCSSTKQILQRRFSEYYAQKEDENNE